MYLLEVHWVAFWPENTPTLCSMQFTVQHAVHCAACSIQPPQGPRCSSQARLEGKVVVITGSNTGIGRFTALDMSRRGAKVVMLCRNLEAAEAAAEAIRKETDGEVVVHK